MTGTGQIIASTFFSTQNVPWLRWLFSAPSSPNPGLDRGPVHFRRVMEMEQVFLGVLRFSCHQSHSTNAPHTTTLMPLRTASRQNLVALKLSSSAYQEALDTQVYSHIFYQASLSQIHLLFPPAIRH